MKLCRRVGKKCRRVAKRDKRTDRRREVATLPAEPSESLAEAVAVAFKDFNAFAEYHEAEVARVQRDCMS